jgi:hypothetical protein
MVRTRTLFADTKPGEYFPEQVIRQHFPCDQAQAVVCKAQLLGKQIEYAVILSSMLYRMRKMEACLLKRIDVSLPGKPRRLASGIPSGKLQ